eukprot:1158116-Pelagomonas_calceolata.AAC.1
MEALDLPLPVNLEVEDNPGCTPGTLLLQALNLATLQEAYENVEQFQHEVRRATVYLPHQFLISVLCLRTVLNTLRIGSAQAVQGLGIPCHTARNTNLGCSTDCLVQQCCLPAA